MILFIALIGGGILVLLYRANAFASVFPSEWSGAGLDLPEGYMRSLTGTFLGGNEDAIILQTAAIRGIDARLLAAIRKAEMGGPGREFGVLSIPAPTYQDQANIAANTIRNNVSRYEGDTGLSAMLDGRYTDSFIAYLGAKYAPIGAGNDPSGLNANWITNVTTWYGRIDYA